MKQKNRDKVLASASFISGGQEVRFDKIASMDDHPERIRLSGWKGGQPDPELLEFSEEEFIEFVHRAIHAGVLSHDFVRKLREWIEI